MRGYINRQKDDKNRDAHDNWYLDFEVEILRTNNYHLDKIPDSTDPEEEFQTESLFFPSHPFHSTPSFLLPMMQSSRYELWEDNEHLPFNQKTNLLSSLAAFCQRTKLDICIGLIVSIQFSQAHPSISILISWLSLPL
jgi:hypothetical protein